MKYGSHCSGGLQMVSHKLLTLADGWVKHDQLCISKNQKLQREAQCVRSKMHLKLYTATPEQKSTLFLCWQIHENRWICIVIYLPNGLWEVQKSKLEAEGSQNDSAKIHIKPMICCTCAQHVKKTMLSEFNDFPQKNSPNRYLDPRGLPWSARRPRREPRGPSDDLKMATKYEKSMRNHTFCKIDVKLVSKRCKTKNLKICGRFPLYFMCFLSGWNDKFLTPPRLTLIAHDVHNYNELKRM